MSNDEIDRDRIIDRVQAADLVMELGQLLDGIEYHVALQALEMVVWYILRQVKAENREEIVEKYIANLRREVFAE